MLKWKKVVEFKVLNAFHCFPYPLFRRVWCFFLDLFRRPLFVELFDFFLLFRLFFFDFPEDLPFRLLFFFRPPDFFLDFLDFLCFLGFFFGLSFLAYLIWCLLLSSSSDFGSLTPTHFRGPGVVLYGDHLKSWDSVNSNQNILRSTPCQPFLIKHILVPWTWSVG